MTVVDNRQVNIQFNIEAENINVIDQLVANINKTSATVVSAGRANDQQSIKARAAAKANEVLSKSYERLNQAVKAFITFEVSRILTGLTRGALDTQNALEVIRDQLTALQQGSRDLGADEFERLQRVSAGLPGNFIDITRAAIQLRNLGLDPSQAALSDLLDLSVGFGKELPQLTEAIADAAVFEFTRLKEAFGIVGKVDGDRVVLTFQGMEIEVEKSASAVVGAIRRISNERFDGAAAEGSDNIRNAFGNLRTEVALTINQFDFFRSASESLAGVFQGLAGDLQFRRGVAGLDNLVARQTELTEKAERYRNSIENATVPIARNSAQSNLAGVLEELEKVQGQYLSLTASFDNDALNQASNNIANTANAIRSTYRELVSDLNDSIGKFTDQDAEDFADRLQRLQLRGISGEDSEFITGLINQLNDLSRAKEIGTEVESVVNNLGDAFSNARREFLDTTNLIDEAISLNLVDRALERSLDEGNLQRYKENILDFVGPQLIEDGSRAAERAIEARNARIQRLLDNGGIAAGVVTEALADETRVAIRAINELTQEQIAERDPFAQFEAQLLQQREGFLQNVTRVTPEIRAALDEMEQEYRRGAVDAISIEVPQGVGFADQLQAAQEQLKQLAEASRGLNDSGVAEKTEQTLRRLAQSAGLLTESEGFDPATTEIQRRLDANERLREAYEAAGLIYEEYVENRTRDSEKLRDREVALQGEIFKAATDGTVTAAQIAAASTQTIVNASIASISGLTDAWADNSRTIFELNQALNLGLATSNFYTGITAAWRQGGVSGLLNGLAATATLLEAIDNIRNTTFGGGGTSLGGGVSAPPSGGNLSGSVGGSGVAGDLNINVIAQGDVIDTGGLNEMVQEGVRNVLGLENQGRINTRFTRRR